MRQWVVIVIIASFSIAASAGVIVLFGGVDTILALQVLASTALIGTCSVAVFCGAVLIGKRWQALGWVAVASAILTLGWCLRLVWGHVGWDEPVFEVTTTACTITGALSICSLLLLLVEHDIRAVRIGLCVTLGLIGIGVWMTMLPIWKVPTSDGYYRAMGIVWILAALGIVVLPILTLALRNGPRATSNATDARLSPASVRRIVTAARDSGISPDELVARAFPIGSTGSTGSATETDQT
ncbi:hypothetical protein [Leucobacter chromiiresistens]|uniref:hypothetical protein n=1 Tax=Leucobacter chromiiresistens TaxID=1079994 RepID=UPI00128F5BEC|nr:hypothetical protein [Leucobacter chromiiresistens]